MHHRSIGPSCLVVALVAVGTSSPPASAGRGEQVGHHDGLRLSIAGPREALHPGGVGVIVVTGSTALTSVQGEVLGRPIRFWPTVSPTEWRGLVGIGLDSKSGAHQVTVQGMAGDAEASTTRLSVLVESRRFDTRRLRVDPRLAKPPEEEAVRIAEEAKAMSIAFAEVTSERLWRGRFEAPVPGAATSSYGRLTVMNGEPGGRHQGTDFRAAVGTPVRAPNAGRVVLAKDLYFAGNTVILDHGLGVFSLVAHLSRIDVAVGERVLRGGVLGESGATGRVTGPHLHWAVRFGDASVDPLSLMAAVATIPDEDARPLAP